MCRDELGSAKISTEVERKIGLSFWADALVFLGHKNRPEHAERSLNPIRLYALNDQRVALTPVPD